MQTQAFDSQPPDEHTRAHRQGRLHLTQQVLATPLHFFSLEIDISAYGATQSVGRELPLETSASFARRGDGDEGLIQG